MNYELLKFDLPKSPASTQRGDDSNYDDDDDDDDVEYLGTIEPPNVNQTNLGANWPIPRVPPMLLATPPLSPLNTSVPQPNMPFITAMLSRISQPVGYSVEIPCYLCKQPFNDIDQLKVHLTIHARELAPAPVVALHPCPLPPRTTVEIENVVARLTNNSPAQEAPPASTQHQTKYCPKVHISTMPQKAHPKQHRPSTTRSKKLFKCNICKKSYKRGTSLAKHIFYKHRYEIKAPLTAPSRERPASAEANADCDQKPRFVWNTKLLNAVAAANYSPATESASKYLPPSVACNQQQMSPCLLRPAKQKYALRSPYFNPNLWLDYDAYIQ